MCKILSFCYHDVIDLNHNEFSGFMTQGAYNYKIKHNEFYSQIQMINKSKVITVNDIEHCIYNDDKKNIILTFDDAGYSSYSVILPILEEFSIKGHFFIPTNFIGKENFLNKENIRELSNLGHIIGSHSLSHPQRISMLSNSDQRLEWKKSKEILEDIVGNNIECASIPNGDTSRSVINNINSVGIKYIFTSSPTENVKKIDNSLIFGRFAIKRKQELKNIYSLINNNTIFIFKLKIYYLLKRSLVVFLGSAYHYVRKIFMNF